MPMGKKLMSVDRSGVRPVEPNDVVRVRSRAEPQMGEALPAAPDPHDFVAGHLFRYGTHLAHGSTTFAAVYLLSHGLAKLVLVVALLQDRTWAYPGMIALLGAFIAYQCYRLADRFTVSLSALTVFDAFVVWLTWREWLARKLRAQARDGPRRGTR